jgi:hypothetical protein
LKCSDLQALPDGLHLSLGNIPVLVPVQIAPMFWDHLHHWPNQQTGNCGIQWFFPGTLPGQLIHADAVMGQVRALGIDLGGARHTALRVLVQELPPTWSPTPSVTAIRSSTNTPPTPASPWPATQGKARSPAEARSEHRSPTSIVGLWNRTPSDKFRSRLNPANRIRCEFDGP